MIGEMNPIWRQVTGLYPYWFVIFLMMTGFYILLARKNLIKAIIGLNIFQTSVFLLYITMGKVRGGTAPIITPDVYAKMGYGSHASDDQDAIATAIEPMTDAFVDSTIYSNPLPSVLMLTAIVVGVATTALALALVVRIREDYGTIHEAKILEMDRQA